MAATTLEHQATTTSDNKRSDVLLDIRAKQAAARYLEFKGYEIVDRDWPCEAGVIDIVAYDVDGTLAFINVRTSREGFHDPGNEAARRRLFESVALAYLGEHDVEDTQVRYDDICLVPVGNDRAMLKHHVNALGVM